MSTYNKTDHHGAYAKAFNQGCDARIAGLSKNTNPYRGLDGEEEMCRNWDLGWHDVNINYGKQAGRATCRVLPPVS